MVVLVKSVQSTVALLILVSQFGSHQVLDSHSGSRFVGIPFFFVQAAYPGTAYPGAAGERYEEDQDAHRVMKKHMKDSPNITDEVKNPIMGATPSQRLKAALSFCRRRYSSDNQWTQAENEVNRSFEEKIEKARVKERYPLLMMEGDLEGVYTLMKNFLFSEAPRDGRGDLFRMFIFSGWAAGWVLNPI